MSFDNTTIKYLFSFLFFAVLVSSCEDAIEVDLAEADNLIVVDAWLHDMEDRTPYIKLGLSQQYFDSSPQENNGSAVMNITTEDGTIYDLAYDTQSQSYLLSNLDGWREEPVGQSFELSISIANLELTAESQKNRVPAIDSIQQEFREDDPFADDGIYCNFFATDLAGIGDSYWIRTFKNGLFLNKAAEINIAFDAGFSSNTDVDNLVFIQPIQELNNPVDENFAPIPYVPGDSIRVELHSITNEAFTYMEIVRDQLLNSSNGIFAEPLANTNGNVTSSDGNEVLGFFNVSSVSVMSDEIR